jgi:uncharacterized protein (TIGR00730 family)
MSACLHRFLLVRSGMSPSSVRPPMARIRCIARRQLSWAEPWPKRNIGVVYGGAKVGLMQAVAESALAAGGRVVGVIPTVLVDLEVAHHGLTELHVTDTMHSRKALIGERSDAFIALPGGFGTLEELFEVLAWQTLKIHAKPILLLNTNGFYDKLLEFLDHCVAQEMLTREKRDIILLAETVEDAMRTLGIAG